MRNLDRYKEPDDLAADPEFLPGLPRQCKKCGTWARYEKPKNQKRGCFTVTCVSCHEAFEIVIHMRGARKL